MTGFAEGGQSGASPRQPKGMQPASLPGSLPASRHAGSTSTWIPISIWGGWGVAVWPCGNRTHAVTVPTWQLCPCGIYGGGGWSSTPTPAHELAPAQEACWQRNRPYAPCRVSAYEWGRPIGGAQCIGIAMIRDLGERSETMAAAVDCIIRSLMANPQNPIS